MSFYQGKKESASVPSRRSVPWMFQVARWTLLGGIAMALLAIFLGQKGWALGLFVGGVLSILNFFGLKSLVEKNLTPESPAGQKHFWLWNACRWVLCVLACWLLLRFSITSLLGALASYLWFLLVLTWVGWKTKPGT